MDTPPQILVIEDDQLLLSAITTKLEKSGLKSIAVTSGREALEILSKSTSLPKVIWLDYYLKDLNGLEFMKAIKDNPKLVKIPVIVVSNSASQDKIKNMLELGARRYILKAQSRLDDIINEVKALAAQPDTNEKNSLS